MFIRRPERWWARREQLVDALGEYARVGCQYVIMRTPDWSELDSSRLFSECLIPALAGA